MSREKFVLDSKFPDASFRQIQGFRGQKWLKVFPLAKIYTIVLRPDNFFVTTRIKSGCMFFFLWKILFLMTGRIKILHIQSNNVFFSRALILWHPSNFVRAKCFRKKNPRTPIWFKYLENKFQPDRSYRVGRKGGKLEIFVQNVGVKKNAKNVEFLRFFKQKNDFWWIKSRFLVLKMDSLDRGHLNLCNKLKKWKCWVEKRGECLLNHLQLHETWFTTHT